MTPCPGQGQPTSHPQSIPVQERHHQQHHHHHCLTLCIVTKQGTAADPEGGRRLGWRPWHLGSLKPGALCPCPAVLFCEGGWLRANRGLHGHIMAPEGGPAWVGSSGSNGGDGCHRRLVADRLCMDHARQHHAQAGGQVGS